MNVIQRFFTGMLCGFVLLTGAHSALAADQSLAKKGQGGDIRLFRTAVDTKGHFTVDATPVLPHLAISFGLLLDFGFNQWLAVESDNVPKTTLTTVGVGSAFPEGKSKRKLFYDNTTSSAFISSVLLFNLGIGNFMVVGAQIPLIINTGSAYDFESNGSPGSSKWSTIGFIGDPGIHVKASLFRSDRDVFGLGAVVQYVAPIGNAEWLGGVGGGGAFNAKLIADIRVNKYYRAAVNVGGSFPLGATPKVYLNDEYATHVPLDPPPGATSTQANVERRERDNQLQGEERLMFNYGSQLLFGIGQSISFWPEVMDLVVEVYGNQVLGEFGNMAYMSMEANAGIKLFVEKNSYLMAGYAHGIPFGATRSGYGLFNVEHRAFIGFAFEPSPPDRDGDGIPDDEDACPDDPEDFDGFEDADGCPDPDNDNDGIPDVEDECPNTPEDFDGDEDEDGCPESTSRDRDGDGIPDDEDKCPDDAEDFDGFEDEDGCPDPDNDKDGILDKSDMCPNDPEDFDGFEDKDGCPELDNDADRILDRDDACPNEPETYNGTEDEDGCPDEGDVVLTDTNIQILKKIHFEYNSAVIKSESFPILDAVGATIKGNPQIGKVEIQGHADERGNDRYNRRLTEQRASAVRKYLTRKTGVPKKQLRSVGYGEFCPLSDESNEEAWEENRRVEFKILEINGQQTQAEISCAKARQKGIGKR